MKKFDQLMQDLGFKPGSSEAAQKAYVRHLQRVANQSGAQVISFPKNKENSEPEQLEMDPKVLGNSTQK